jgi:glycosyltransferase involved in cell wall biosynthesis
VDGKHFAVGDERFHLRGVTYGTVAPREDGARFPEREVIKRDFAAMAEAGFTTVRTYTPPPEDVIELAADWDLRLLAGIFWPDWRYLVGRSRDDLRDVARSAARQTREEARRFAGCDQVIALSLGNEVPADVLRWYGSARIGRVIADLAEVAREENPEGLVTYANYPTAEYLSLPTLDFLTFNVFLDKEQNLRRYLTRLHHLAGDRPLVLGEIGRHVEAEPDEHIQADFLDRQLRVAVERGVAGTCVFSWTDEWHVGEHAVEGWRFGLTRADRSPRPALDVAERWNARTVRDLDVDWPSMSVVVCAYNAEPTMAECLSAATALDYPDLEILVVDDGSTDRTADIAETFPTVRVLREPHAGLSVARNVGWREARGDLVVYLDSDAFPAPEWPYYLALGMDGPMVGGVGGPNVPPPSDGLAAQRVARAPGGPVHVLLSDDRAEHVPGCNMAFWKIVLAETGGFDPIYTAAGDDVDLCWKVLDRGWDIGFHPAALVWHHRRGSVRAYLRQQRGYGKAEALVAQRHPERFTPLGTASWRGRIYDSFAPAIARQRVYRGIYGSAAYQSVYGAGGHTLDIAHQLGVPAALVALAAAPLALLAHELLLLPLLALTLLVTLAAIDTSRAQPPRSLGRRSLGFRLGVAFLHLAQPVVRTWGRLRERVPVRKQSPPYSFLQGPVTRTDDGTLLLPEVRPRAEFVSSVVGNLRRARIPVAVPSGWETYDADLLASVFVRGELITSSHPPGWVQVRVRRRPRLPRVGLTLVVLGATALLTPWLSAAILVGCGFDIMRGWRRTGSFVRLVIEEATR